MLQRCSKKKFGGKVEIEVENAYGAFKVDTDHRVVKMVKKSL